MQSLLYRCPDGYLFSSATLRCNKESEVMCPASRLGADTFSDVSYIQLTERQLDAFFQRWS